MTKKRTAFIVVTGLFCLAMLPGAVMDIAQPDMVVATVAKLGIPVHLLTLVGIWKLLGFAALASPRYRRVNEWAYAGFFFDLTGAAYVHAAGGDVAGIAPPLVLLCLLVGSYSLRSAMGQQLDSLAAGHSSIAPAAS